MGTEVAATLVERGPAVTTVVLAVNGNRHEVPLEPRVSLLDALRDVSASGFTLTTSAGEKVTVKEASSTTYKQVASPASASAVTTGAPVLVLGVTDGTTITATEVIVQPPASTASSPGGRVIAFSKGTKGSSQTVGTIPSDYTQGSGTLASGTTADKATEAALAAYPGGVVDRVVELSNGDYEATTSESAGPTTSSSTRTSRSSAPTHS
ncbi:MAG TPA: hypothetical protein VIZ43_03160 [Trebonia sp.]